MVLNPTRDPLTLTWDIPREGTEGPVPSFRQAFVTGNVAGSVGRQVGGVLTVELPPLSAGVWIRE